MIVLDEQLLSYGLQASIARWYRGTVTDITQLRPHTVILDDAIPMLLRAVARPTFVTINVADFWRRVAPDTRFCIVCCAVPHTRAQDVLELVRRVLALEPFRTRSRRLGTMVRVSPQHVHYYTTDTRTLHRIAWPTAPRQRSAIQSLPCADPSRCLAGAVSVLEPICDVWLARSPEGHCSTKEGSVAHHRKQERWSVQIIEFSTHHFQILPPQGTVATAPRHMRLKGGLKRRDQLLKFVARQAGQIQELRRALLHVGALYMGHAWGLL